MSNDALREHLLDQFRYTDRVNRQVIDALEGLEPGAEADRGLELLSHLVRTQDVWLSRVRGGDQPALWETDSLAACRERNEESLQAWMDLVHSEPDLSKEIRYENSKGRTFTNELREICTHVVDHSTHHRAQILAAIREAGEDPPVTGYIFYAR